MGGIQSDDIGYRVRRQPAVLQDHNLRVGIGLPHALQLRHQKRRIDQRSGEAGALDDRAGLVADSLRFEFENHTDGASRNVQGLLQRGDTLPIPRIEPLDLLKRHLGHVSALVGGAVDGVVVQQHKMTVAGRAEVDFDEICVKRAGFPNSGESVLGGVAGGSPMTDAKDGGDSDLA